MRKMKSNERRPLVLLVVVLLVICCVSHEFVSGASATAKDKDSSKFRNRRARTPEEIVL